jgi:5S rRNA maturation endonuclease (ribonuclease M5)
LRAPLEVRLEKFQKLIEQISLESQDGSIIVVEGLRDKDALRNMGVSGTILSLQNSRMNTMSFAEQLSDTRGVVVLTDFDRQGVFLAKSLSRSLNAQHVRTNLILWRDLRRLAKSDARSIEELPKLYERLQNNLFAPRKLSPQHTRRVRDSQH